MHIYIVNDNNHTYNPTYTKINCFFTIIIFVLLLFCIRAKRINNFILSVVRACQYEGL